MPVDIRHRVREAREAAGLSVSEVARRAGVCQPHLLRYERGDRDLSGEKLARVMQVLGLDVLPTLNAGDHDEPSESDVAFEDQPTELA